MKIAEFSKKYKFSSRDSRVAEKIYGSAEKEESDWYELLKNDFSIRAEAPKKESTQEKIERLKAEKIASKPKNNKTAKNK